MSNRYTIEIIVDAPPRLCLGDVIAGGQIVGINCANDEPDIVSAAWLADKLTLSNQPSSIAASISTSAQMASISIIVSKQSPYSLQPHPNEADAAQVKKTR